jgi:threonine dehydrogenase-like Zn-dependent dehydrogenase
MSTAAMPSQHDRYCTGVAPYRPSRALVVPAPASFAVLMAIALNGVRLAHIQSGESVAVLGQGLVGQLAAQSARINGARPVVTLDALPARLEIAHANGATHAIDVREAGDAQELIPVVRAATGGDGPRVVIEATGVPQPACASRPIWCAMTRFASTGCSPIASPAATRPRPTPPSPRHPPSTSACS